MNNDGDVQLYSRLGITEILWGELSEYDHLDDGAYSTVLKALYKKETVAVKILKQVIGKSDVSELAENEIKLIVDAQKTIEDSSYIIKVIGTDFINHPLL